MSAQAVIGEQGGQGGKPQEFNVSTPATGPRERAPYNPNWRFDHKVSLDAKFQYDHKDTAAWQKK